MQKIKILNIVHNSFNKRSMMKSQIDYLKNYFGNKKPNWTPKIDFEFDEISIDFEIEMKYFGKSSQGKKAFGADNIKRHIRKVVKQNRYDVVIFWYKPKYVKGFKFGRDFFAPLTYKENLYNGTALIQMPSNINRKRKHVLTHEFTHAYGHLIGAKKDYMDKTPITVNGKIIWKSYWKNEFPYHIGGNFNKTWLLFKGKKNNVPSEVVVGTKPPTKGKIKKYFNIKELIPLSVYKVHGEKAWRIFPKELLDNLLFIRENIGKPIRINNYKRNLQFRGYDNGYRASTSISWHKFGRAVDFDVIGMTAQQVRQWIRDNYQNFPHPHLRLERLKNGKEISWIHMDIPYDQKGLTEFNV